MPIAYFDCASGISGDMTLAALIDAGADLAAVQAGLDSLQISGLKLVSSQVKRHGFRALHVVVEHVPEHKHRHLHHIEALIEKSSLNAKQRETAKAIFKNLAIAEAAVHGTTIEKVHFHEVGAVDSIADILGVSIALDLLEIDTVYCSPTPTGNGTIVIEHGRVGVPAPATAELLKGIPIVVSSIEAELTTPTGAAILATLAKPAQHTMPAMVIQKIGQGAGSRDFPSQANILRVYVGAPVIQSDVPSPVPAGFHMPSQEIWEVETNLDSLSGEELGFALERLWELEPLDVFTTSIQMKKGRPAARISVLCEDEQLAAVEQAIFRYTGSLGVRRHRAARTTAPRKQVVVQTAWGRVPGKLAIVNGRTVFAAEYDGCKTVALREGLGLKEVRQEAERAFLQGQWSDAERTR